MSAGPGHREGFVKRVVCHACGAPKITRSATAFVYCDFCAALTDWDFQIAISDPASKLPGPAYEEIGRQLAKPLAKARKRGDEAAYLELQRRVFETYVTECPAACPPRCAEPAYRALYVEYQAKIATIAAFDAESKRRVDVLQDATSRLAWRHDAHGDAKVEAKSFWRMYEALVASMADLPDGRAHPSYALTHPDGAPIALLRKMSMSMFVQGWIPFLPEGASDALLAKTGLAAEYVKAPAVPSHAATCGGCGKGMTIPDAAKRTLCEACGHVVDAGHAPLPCTGCGAALAVPEGKNTFACPFCKTELRAMRW